MFVNCRPSMLPSSLSATAMPLWKRSPSTWSCHSLRDLSGNIHEAQLHMACSDPMLLMPPLTAAVNLLIPSSRKGSHTTLQSSAASQAVTGSRACTGGVCYAPVALHNGDVLEGQGAEHRPALVADLDGGGARLQDAAIHQQQLHPAAGCSHARGQSDRAEVGQV